MLDAGSYDVADSYTLTVNSSAIDLNVACLVTVSSQKVFSESGRV